MKVRMYTIVSFEDNVEQESVYAWHEYMEGYIIFKYCMNLTLQVHKLTRTQFNDKYSRV